MTLAYWLGLWFGSHPRPFAVLSDARRENCFCVASIERLASPDSRRDPSSSNFVPIGITNETSLTKNDIDDPDRDVFLITFFLHVIFVPKGMMMHSIAATETFGALVRAERKSQKLTQEQLAGLAGVGVRFVRELEAGKASCQLGRALQVARTLGLVVSVSTRREIRP